MIRFRTVLAGAMIWLATVCSSPAFSLLGQILPGSWQVPGLGYDLAGDIGGPLRPSDGGFRWNLPVITYAFDQSFINYFGAEGMRAVNEAMTVFNDLPPVSQISHDGFSFFVNGEIVPTRSTLVNQDAAELGLIDLKSVAMRMVIEELGLASPERWAWSLRGRSVTTVTPPPNITNYTVVNLNFDPITLQPTPIVNGILYDYNIVETPNPFVSEAVEIPVDELDVFSFTSVADARGLLTIAFDPFTGVIRYEGGRFFTGLTHDDVGGLRWLYHPNHMAVENLETNVVFGTPLRSGVSGSPWTPFFGGSNVVVIGTNTLFNTNLLVREGLRGGINEIRFRRVNYDSLLGRTFVPITNQYMDTFITNGQRTVQPVQRVITQPDIIFVVEDLGISTGLVPFLTGRTATTAWENNDAINGRDTETDEGPGVITPPIFITFTDQLPAYFNSTAQFFFGGSGSTGPLPPNDAPIQDRFFTWGSFDESSTPPIIYPQYGNITVQDLRRFAVGGGN
jgi:hypothetical protein